MSEEQLLSRAALNRALLARQMLLERADLPLPEALERMGGVQAQYAPSMYIGLWSRLEAFARDQLTASLEERAVVQGTLMRATIHLVSARDYWPFAVAIREARRTMWLRAHARRLEHAEDDLVAAAHRLREALVGGPLAAGVGLWLDLVRVPPSGTWERRRADLYAAAEDWLEPPGVARHAAVEHLVRRYLAAFGPATRGDVASWAGLAVRDFADVLERMELRRLRGEDGEELLDLPDGPLPDPRTPAPVRFLPVWDATLLVHARRTGILPEEYRPLVFNTRTPHSVNTFLVDGAVAGTWRCEKGRVELQAFGELDASTWRELGRESEALAALHA